MLLKNRSIIAHCCGCPTIMVILRRQWLCGWQLNVWCEIKLLEKKKAWSVTPLTSGPASLWKPTRWDTSPLWFASFSPADWGHAVQGGWPPKLFGIARAGLFPLRPAQRADLGLEMNCHIREVNGQTTDNSVSPWWQMCPWQNNNFDVLISYLKGVIKSHILRSAIIN